ncbi:alpha/beta fold hydrolase [Nonomuraea sp. NPDC049649]|uniref:alpha/beta fold hydrolase n=1 Tax=Nonomuraea sp. NPDC049649 TaxID=3155776 RepID=UPI00341EC99B
MRSGTGRGTPVLMTPGGPGVASVVPYRGLRKQAARRKLDVLMVEHRGVGLSRTDTTGVDLAVEQVTLENAADDLAAVLDAAGVERAVVVRQLPGPRPHPGARQPLTGDRRHELFGGGAA